MMVETFKTLFNREIFQLKKEIELYRDEKNIWKVAQNIANSGGGPLFTFS